MPRYEAHLTFSVGHASTVRQAATDYGWVYSQITGCPLLGPGTYCYLTNYSTDAHKLHHDLVDIQHRVNAPCLRAKIERIVYDTKTGVYELADVSSD